MFYIINYVEPKIQKLGTKLLIFLSNSYSAQRKYQIIVAILLNYIHLKIIIFVIQILNLQLIIILIKYIIKESSIVK
jgi:hypothetical protein